MDDGMFVTDFLSCIPTCTARNRAQCSSIGADDESRSQVPESRNGIIEANPSKPPSEASSHAGDHSIEADIGECNVRLRRVLNQME